MPQCTSTKPLRGEAKPRAADQPRELDAGAGEFAGNYRTQFLNTGLAIPMSLAMVPISAYGGGVIVLPWEGVILSGLALPKRGADEQRRGGREATEDCWSAIPVPPAMVAPTGFG